MMNRIRTRIHARRAVNQMPYAWRPAPPRG